MSVSEVLSVGANLGQALAAVVAVIGIPLAVRQLSIQNKQSQFSGLEALERMWLNRVNGALERMGADANNVEDGLHEKTIERASELLRARGTDVAANLSEIRERMPGLVLAISPRLADAYHPGGAPRNERQYIAALRWRCDHLFPVLDAFAADADEIIRKDLHLMLAIVNAFATRSMQLQSSLSSTS